MIGAFHGFDCCSDPVGGAFRGHRRWTELIVSRHQEKLRAGRVGRGHSFYGHNGQRRSRTHPSANPPIGERQRNVGAKGPASDYQRHVACAVESIYRRNDIERFANPAIVCATGAACTAKIETHGRRAERDRCSPERGIDRRMHIASVKRVRMGDNDSNRGSCWFVNLGDQLDFVGGHERFASGNRVVGHGEITVALRPVSKTEKKTETASNGLHPDDRLPIKMLNDRILVDLNAGEGERLSTGGILIPATAQVGKRLAWGTIVAVGANVRNMESGDQVLFNPNDRFEVEVRGMDYIVLRERDVHAVAAERLEEGSTGLYL